MPSKHDQLCRTLCPIPGCHSRWHTACATCTEIAALTDVERLLSELAEQAKVHPPRALYSVTHWDTFEAPGEDTILIGRFETLADAEAFVLYTYGPDGPPGQRLSTCGADRIEIRFLGAVVQEYPVG